MRLFDGFRLANAKLRSHRIRTGILTVVVSLLFACIVLVLCIIAGTTQSLESFGKEGLGGRFILRGTPIVDMNMLYGASNETLITQLTPVTDQLKKDKAAEAKRLGLEYDPKNDQTLPLQTFDQGNGQKMTVPNMSSSVTRDAIRQYYLSLPHLSFADFSNNAKNHGAVTTFQSSSAASMGANMSLQPTQGTVGAIINGKEKNPIDSKQTKGMPTGVDTLIQSGFSQFDTELLTPFLLPNQDLKTGSDGSIPVIIPVSAAQELLGRTAPPSSASSKDQLAFLEQLRKDIAGKQATLCYRNTASADLYTQAYQQQDEIARNKSNKDYVVPSLQYNIPTDACGEVTVKKDTRSAEEKKLATNTTTFKQQFEGYQDPAQGLINIRVVGIVPEINYSGGFSAKDIITSMVTSTVGTGWFTSIDAIQSGSLAAHISMPYNETLPVAHNYYAEFPSYAATEDFLKQQSCTFTVNYAIENMYDPTKPDPRVTTCNGEGKYYDYMPFGNNASAIEDLKQMVWKGVLYAAPVVLIIASLVLMGVIGKMIADSRRETAVFRALGATRLHIAQIYFTYSFYIGLIISMLSLLIGAIVAYVISQKLSPDASVAAVLAYNSQDVLRPFTFFGFEPLYIVLVFGLIMASTFLATLLPLLTNVRRNPIRDMRDE